MVTKLTHMTHDKETNLTESQNALVGRDLQSSYSSAGLLTEICIGTTLFRHANIPVESCASTKIWEAVTAVCQGTHW